MNPYSISPQQQQQQQKEERLRALEQENAMRQNAQYTPYSYPGYPWYPIQQPSDPQNYPQQPNQQMPPQQQQPTPQPIPTTQEPQQAPNEYLQGYPIEGFSQLREARVGLDGRVSIFPFLAENSIYTKNTNLDGLPEYRRYILDESFSMEEIANPDSEATKLETMLKQILSTQDELRAELKALKEEKKNESVSTNPSAATEPQPAADNSAGDAKRSKPNATSSTTAKSKPADATVPGDPAADAKG